MTDYTQARTNMIDSQIHPMGVVQENLLQAFQDVPRDLFVPECCAAHAYADIDIMCDDGRFLIEPATHARLIQELKIESDHTVLDIGGTNGYSAAILSHLAQTVIAVDSDKIALDQAEKLWKEVGIFNVVGYCVDDSCSGYEVQAPFDSIFVNGAMSEVPMTLLNQLKDGGRLATVLKPESGSQGRAVVYVRSGDEFSACPLFDSNIPYMPGCRPKEKFVF